MATLTATTAFNYTTIPEFGDTATLLINSPTQVKVQESTRVYLMEGTDLEFLGSSGFNAGTLSHIKLTTGGAVNFEVTGGSYDTASNLYDGGYVVSSKIAGFTVAGGKLTAMAAEASAWMAGNDILNGSAYNDRLGGFNGNDRIYGNNGNDRLEGWAGNDTLYGGVGNDTLYGGSGSDYFDAGAGNDRLYGGIDATGNEIFVFNTALSASTNLDIVYNFGTGTGSTNNDRIYLDDDIFSALGTVASTTALAASRFVGNTAGVATDTADRIVYDTDSGALYYDRDGSGAAAKVQFATLSGHPTLSVADFYVTA